MQKSLQARPERARSRFAFDALNDPARPHDIDLAIAAAGVCVSKHPIPFADKEFYWSHCSMVPLCDTGVSLSDWTLTMKPTLTDLASDALYAVSDLLDDDELSDLEAAGELAIVQYRYKHADCDDFAFALHVLTSWPVATVVSASKGPLHRLNIAPDGRYVDVTGYVSDKDLRKRYGARDLTITNVGDAHMSLIDDDVQLKAVMAVMTHLKCAPFFWDVAERARKFIENGRHFDDDDAPAITARTARPGC